MVHCTMVRTTRVLKNSPARERNRSRLPAPQNTGSFTAMHGTMVLSETPRCDVFSPFFDYSYRDRLVRTRVVLKYEGELNAPDRARGGGAGG